MALSMKIQEASVSEMAFGKAGMVKPFSFLLRALKSFQTPNEGTDDTDRRLARRSHSTLANRSLYRGRSVVQGSPQIYDSVSIGHSGALESQGPPRAQGAGFHSVGVCVATPRPALSNSSRASDMQSADLRAFETINVSMVSVDWCSSMVGAVRRTHRLGNCQVTERS